MPQEWWILRDNEMSDRTYTRNELLHLDDFGPTTEVCRTNSNTWVEARRDPALASLFDNEDGDRREGSSGTTSSAKASIDFIPRYYRLLAGLFDLALLVLLVVLFDFIAYGVDFRPRTLFLLGFLAGGLTIPLFDAGLIDSETPGKRLFGLTIVRIEGKSHPLPVDFGRYLTAYGPILLLGVAFDPSLPHDPITRYVSLMLGSIGLAALLVNAYLFCFNNPTYRLLQDYLFGDWVLPETTGVVPEVGFLRPSQLLPLSLTVFVALGLAFGGWQYFWVNKTPPVLSVPEQCQFRENVSLITDEIRPGRYRDMLLDGQFGRLESELRTLFEAYRSGDQNDAHLELAMGAFEVMDRAVGRRINQWVIQDPQSPYALLARAKFHLREARVMARLYDGAGGDEQLAAALEQARISARKALNVNSKIPSTYGVLVAINQLEGRGEENAAILDRALKLDPPSVAVWQQALLTEEFTVRPDPKKLNDQLRQVSRAIARSPALNVFCGLPAQSMGDRYQRRQDYRTADKYYEMALKYGDAPWVRLRRALNGFRGGSSQTARRAFSAAVIDLANPTNGILARARIHFKQDAYSQSLEALNLALEREPHHPRALYLHARVLNHIGETDRALEQLRAAGDIVPDWRRTKQLQDRIAKKTKP